MGKMRSNLNILHSKCLIKFSKFGGDKWVGDKQQFSHEYKITNIEVHFELGRSQC